MIDIFYINDAHKINASEIQSVLHRMPSSILNEIMNYKFIQQQQHSLFGKLLLQYAIKYHNLDVTLNDIFYTNKERPALFINFDFNIAHSGNCVVLACSQNNRIGIDIEQHRPIDNHLFKKYFTTLEWNDIIEHNRFFDYWCIKEAAIKCDGRGVELLSKTKIINTTTLSCDELVLSYQLLDIEKNYSSCICSKQPITNIKIHHVDTLHVLNI